MAVSQGFLRAYIASSQFGPDHTQDTQDLPWSYTSGAQQHNLVTISGGAFTALTIPASAKGVVFKMAATAVNVTLKGAAADTGILLDPQNGMPVQLSLRDNSSQIGLQNGGANFQAEFWWH